MVMTDVEVLKSYRDILMEIIAIEDQLERAGTTGAPAPLGAIAYDKPGGATNDRTAASMQAQDGIEQLLQARWAELNAIAERFHSIVTGVRNAQWRTILYRYYALGETDEQVAEKMGIGSKAVNRARNEALATL